MVGITVLPARLTRVAPAGTVTLPLGPTCAMRPPVTTMVALSIGALPSPTMTRAPSKAVVPAGAWAPTGCGPTQTSSAAGRRRRTRIGTGDVR